MNLKELELWLKSLSISKQVTELGLFFEHMRQHALVNNDVEMTRIYEALKNRLIIMNEIREKAQVTEG